MPLVPQLVTSLRGYDRSQLLADLSAGIVVGVVALPLAIAFAIASGVTPEKGLYTAIVAGFLISALGGSRVQIGGPTGAFVVIVYGIVQQYGVAGLSVATLMAGVILIVLGVARLGGAIKFIPHPVTTGFTAGIAVLIASNEVRNVLGLRMEAVPAEFIEKVEAYGSAVGTTNLWAAGVAALTLTILVGWRRISHRVPSPIVALLVTTALVHYFAIPVETVGSRFGEVHVGIPRPHLPELALSDIRALVGPAFAIAALGAIESLLSAVVADGMTGWRHRSNMELVAQGVANIASPIFGGIPATGAIARTATNVKSGGRTPIAGMTHAVVLLLIGVLFGRWAALIPMATLGGILLLVAYQMSEWRVFRAELRAPRSDVAVLLSTFLLTVLVDLTVAIGVGMVLACVLFMKRMAEVTNISLVTRDLGDADGPAPAGATLDRRALPRGVEVYEINGPFFFGAAETFKDTLARVAGKPRVLIIRMRNVPAIDSTGIRALHDVVKRSRGDGTLVLLAEVHAQPLTALQRSSMAETMRDSMHLSLEDALDRAREHLSQHPRTPTPGPMPAADADRTASERVP